MSEDDDYIDDVSDQNRYKEHSECGGDKEENKITKLYVLVEDYFWQTRNIWTVSFTYWQVDPKGNRTDFPKIIQNKETINRVIKNFDDKYKEDGLFLTKDIAEKYNS